MTAQKPILSSEEIQRLLIKTHLAPRGSKDAERLVVCCMVEQDEGNDLSWYRAHLICKILKKIYTTAGWTLASSDVNTETTADLKLLLTLNAVPNNKGQLNFDMKRIVVGVVRNVETKQKETEVSLGNYICMREEDISSIDGNSSLAQATVDFELFHVGIGSCVNLDFTPSPKVNRGSSNRGIIFSFYNYARITTILRKHEEKVVTGEYPPLPALDDSILNMLVNMKPEQKLITSCLKKYAIIMEKVLPVNVETLPQPHLLHRFLSEVSHPISRYYRTHHILTEPSPHLLPTMHARLHVMKAVQTVLQNLFHLICVEPPSSM